MIIRNARLDDIEKMSFIHAMAWKDTYKGIFPQDFLDQLSEKEWINRFEDMIINNRSSALIAEEGSNIMGDCIFGKSRDDRFPDDGEIYAINVLPALQKKGIGRKLITEALASLKNTGKYPEIFLKVVDKNINARSFYEHLGFYDSGIIIKDKIKDFYFKEIVYKYKFSQKELHRIPTY